MSRYPGPKIVPAPCIQLIESNIAPKLKSKSLNVLLPDFKMLKPFLGLIKNI